MYGVLHKTNRKKRLETGGHTRRRAQVAGVCMPSVVCRRAPASLTPVSSSSWLVRLHTGGTRLLVGGDGATCLPATRYKYIYIYIRSRECFQCIPPGFVLATLDLFFTRSCTSVLYNILRYVFVLVLVFCFGINIHRQREKSIKLNVAFWLVFWAPRSMIPCAVFQRMT